jgi:hypothetical protein
VLRLDVHPVFGDTCRGWIGCVAPAIETRKRLLLMSPQAMPYPRIEEQRKREPSNPEQDQNGGEVEAAAAWNMGRMRDVLVGIADERERVCQAPDEQ